MRGDSARAIPISRSGLGIRPRERRTRRIAAVGPRRGKGTRSRQRDGDRRRRAKSADTGRRPARAGGGRRGKNEQEKGATAAEREWKCESRTGERDASSRLEGRATRSRFIYKSTSLGSLAASSPAAPRPPALQPLPAGRPALRRGASASAGPPRAGSSRRRDSALLPSLILILDSILFRFVYSRFVGDPSSDAR